MANRESHHDLKKGIFDEPALDSYTYFQLDRVKFPPPDFHIFTRFRAGLLLPGGNSIKMVQ